MLDTILNFISSYGIIAICIAIFLEYACFPVPSEVILPLAGALSIQNNISFFVIIPLSIVFGLLGSLVCYLIGYYGGFPIIEKIKRKYPKSEKSFSSIDEKYQGLSISSICFGRLIPICRTYISFIAGANRMKPLKYIFYTSIGIAIWNIALITLGRVFYDNLDVVSDFYQKYKIIIISILLLTISLVLFKKIKKSIKKHKNTDF